MVSLTYMTALAGALLAAHSAQALDKNLHGVNYDMRKGADWAPEKCKTDSEIAADIKTLSSITGNVRTYSLSDCDVTPVIKAAKDNGLKVWLGVWVSEDEKVFEGEVAAFKKLVNAGLIDSNVIAINVGSEAVYRKDITADTAVSYLKKFRDVVDKLDADIKLSITDIIDTLLEHKQIIEASDIVTVNQFPFWEKVDAKEAASQFLGRIQPLLKQLDGKELVITETGWPTSGKEDKGSVASPENAVTYLNDFYNLAEQEDWKYYWFAGFDSPYKAEQSGLPNTVETSFGIFDKNGNMKSEFSDMKIKEKKIKASGDSSKSSSTKSTASSGDNKSGDSNDDASANGDGKSSTKDSTSDDGGKSSTTKDNASSDGKESSDANSHSSATTEGKTESKDADTESNENGGVKTSSEVDDENKSDATGADDANTKGDDDSVASIGATLSAVAMTLAAVGCNL